MPTGLTEEQRERWQRSLEEALKRKAAAEERQRCEHAQLRVCGNVNGKSATNNNIGAHQHLAHQFQYQQQSVRPSQPTKNQQHQALIRRPQPQPLHPLQPLPTRPLQRQQPNPPPIVGLDEAPALKVVFKFTLIDAERFKLSYQPFRDFITDRLKEVPSRVYDHVDRSWNFALKDYELCKQKINALREQHHRLEMSLEETPMGVRKYLFLDKISPMHSSGEPTTSMATLNGREEEELLRKVDPRVRGILFPFQRRGVSFGIQRGGRLLVADEMGLGKTVQAIAIASAFRSEWPLLIVCPSSVKYMWARQVFHFLPDTRPCVIEKARDPLPSSRATNLVIIMSYDLMSMRLDELRRNAFYALIFDECHMLKERTSKRTKAADNLAKRASRLLMLSGTPALSRPVELYSQIRMLDPRIFPNFNEYALRYCEGRQGRWGFEAKGQSNPLELKAVMNRIMIRRLKREVLEDLPEKRRELVYLSGDLIDNKMKQLMKAREELQRNDRLSNDRQVKTQSFMEYYVLTGQAKMGAVAQHLVDTYFYQDAPEKKVLVFAHHLPVLDHLAVQLAKAGVQYIRIDGSTNAKDRQAYCEQFQTDSRTRVALLSITAAGTGITLTAASIVIFAELYWNPSLLIQAEDRAHRVGQRDSVHVQYMLAKGTADMDIWEMVSSKLQVLGNVNLANETYGDAKKSSKLCVDPEEQHLLTDYFQLLNEMDEEAEEKRAGEGHGTDHTPRKPEPADGHDKTVDVWLGEEPDLKRAKTAHDDEVEESKEEEDENGGMEEEEGDGEEDSFEQ